MIACVCNGISDDQIREWLNQGYTIQQIMSDFDVGCGCGTCINYLVEMAEGLELKEGESDE